MSSVTAVIVQIVRGLGAAVLVLLAAPIFAVATPLEDSLWWYPETDAYQLWVLLVAGLAVVTQQRWRGGKRVERWLLRGLWLGAVAVAYAGLLELVSFTVDHMQCGDLLQNYLEGARRVARGAAVYDLAGLTQGVNASPVAIALFSPLTGLADQQAIAHYLVLNLAALALFVAGAGLLIRRIKGSLTLPDAALAFVGAFTFNTLQRSWRLGQLDTILLAALTLGLALLPHRGRHRGGAASAPLLALAAGLKMLPVLAAGPMILAGLRALLKRDGPHRGAPRWVVIFGLTLCLLGGLAAARVGTAATLDFVRNIHHITRSTTSGNNYALVTRVATFNNRQVRLEHTTLSPAYSAAGGAVAVGTTLFLLLFTWRMRRAGPTLLASVWLAATPLISPVCWDIYLLWCSFLPWLVLWAHLTGTEILAGVSRAARMLLWTALPTSYLLAGTFGNTSFTDLKKGVTVHLDLPLWMDELPLAGHLMLAAALLAVTVLDHRRAEAPGEERT